MTRTHLSWIAPIASVSFIAVTAVLSGLNDGYRMWGITVRGYSWVAQPISGLGLGRTAGAMTITFVLFGLAILVASVGSWSRWRRWDPRVARWTTATLVLGGLGSILCGVFDLGSMAGHSVGFLLLLAPLVTLLRIGALLRRHPNGHRAAVVLAWVAWPVTLLLSVAFFTSFDAIAAGTNSGVAGLTQRLLVGELMILWSVLALAPAALLRRAPNRSEELASSAA